MFGIGSTEFLVILLVALVVLGPKSLASVSRTLGKAMGEFRRVSTDFQRTLNAEVEQEEHLKRKQEAEAYKEAVISKAEGEAQRFSSVYDAYKTGKLVTSKRHYLETMEDVLQKSKKVIMEPGQKSSNMMPILPLK